MPRCRMCFAVGPVLVGAVAGVAGCQAARELQSCAPASAPASCSRECASAELDQRGAAYREQSIHPTLTPINPPTAIESEPLPTATGLDPFDPHRSARDRDYTEEVMAPAPNPVDVPLPQPISFQHNPAAMPSLEGHIESDNPVQLGMPELLNDTPRSGPVALEPLEPIGGLFPADAVPNLVQPAMQHDLANSVEPRWERIPLTGKGPVITPWPKSAK